MSPYFYHLQFNVFTRGHIVSFQVCYHTNRFMSLQTRVMQSSYSLHLCLFVISRSITLFSIDTPAVCNVRI